MKERGKGVGAGHRKRKRKNQANSTLSVDPDVGLDLTTLEVRPELKPRVRHLNDFASQAPSPLHLSFFNLESIDCIDSTYLFRLVHDYFFFKFILDCILSMFLNISVIFWEF